MPGEDAFLDKFVPELNTMIEVDPHDADGGTALRRSTHQHRPIQLPQCRGGNRLKIRVPSIFQSLFGWVLSQVFTRRMISVGTPSA